MATTPRQSASNYAAGAPSTVTATLGSTPVTGNKLIAAISLGVGSSETVTGVKDANNVAFTKIDTTGFYVATEVSLWAMDVPATPSGAITATKSGFGFGISLIVQEVPGLAPGSTVAAMCDATPAHNTGTSTGATTAVSYSSAVTAEYAVSVYGDDGNNLGTLTGPSGWTVDSHNLTNAGAVPNAIAIAYRDSVGGVENNVWTNGASQNWGQVLVAFKLSGIHPTTVAAVATVPAPTLVVPAVPTTVAAPVTVPTPTVTAGTNTIVTPSPVSATATVFGPIVGGNVFLTLAPVVASATVLVPTVQRNAVVTPSAVAAVATVPAPTIVAGLSITLTPAAVHAVATVPGPGIQSGSSTNLVPATVTATATVPSLVGSVSFVITPLTVGATATVPAPTLPTPAAITPAAVHATATVPVPTVTTGLSAFPAPAPAQAIVTVPVPVITSITGTFATSATVAARVTVPTPIVFAGFGAFITPATVDAYVTVIVPQQFKQVFDLLFRVGRPTDRWFAGDPANRWKAGHRSPAWVAHPTVARWTVPSHGRLTMSQTLSTASLEYVRVPITASKSGVAFDPTVDAVAMAFQASPAAPSLFYNGAWETTGTSFYALCLVGPGGVVQLSPGTWYVWVKITDAPEIPVLDAGVILVR